MDLQSRKIEFVQEFLKLENEALVSHFEQLLRNIKKESTTEEVKALSVEELNKRIKQSELDFEEGKFKSSTELLSKYKQ
ncbi:MAG: hypothetical protein WD048_05655 [Chitinophagales bacterium]